MKICDLNQGSDGWIRWRESGLGASDAPLIIHGKHFDRTLLELWEEKVQHIVLKKKPRERKLRNTSAMARGQRLEPFARERYEKLLGVKAKPLCCVHDQYDWLKASLDGWVKDSIVLEIKAPNRLVHEQALAGEVVGYYQPQLDHQLLVTGAREAHFVSYNDYFKGVQQFALVKYIRDEKKIQEYLGRACRFWDQVLNGKPPEPG